MTVKEQDNRRESTDSATDTEKREKKGVTGEISKLKVGFLFVQAKRNEFLRNLDMDHRAITSLRDADAELWRLFSWVFKIVEDRK